MKTHYKNKIYVSILALPLMAFTQSFAQYEMKKYSINNGGATMTGGSFEIKGSSGQVDASAKLTSANYSLSGGFWHGINESNGNGVIFLNGFE